MPPPWARNGHHQNRPAAAALSSPESGMALYRPRKQKGHTWSIFRSVANSSAARFISSPPPNGHLTWHPRACPQLTATAAGTVSHGASGRPAGGAPDPLLIREKGKPV